MQFPTVVSCMPRWRNDHVTIEVSRVYKCNDNYLEPQFSLFCSGGNGEKKKMHGIFVKSQQRQKVTYLYCMIATHKHLREYSEILVNY